MKPPVTIEITDWELAGSWKAGCWPEGISCSPRLWTQQASNPDARRASVCAARSEGFA